MSRSIKQSAGAEAASHSAQSLAERKGGPEALRGQFLPAPLLASDGPPDAPAHAALLRRMVLVQQTGTVKAKLVVGAPDDVYEQEAEQIARHVAHNTRRDQSSDPAISHAGSLARGAAQGIAKASTVQRWESPEHIKLGDEAGGASTGLIVLECYDRDFPERKGPVDSWPSFWKKIDTSINNTRGDGPWIAFGDNFLTDARNSKNLTLAEEAVRLSKQDIVDTMAKKSAFTMPTTFAAEKLVPFPTSPGTDRWKGSDRTKVQAGLAASELPGVASEAFTDDNDVRNWVSRRRSGEIGRQPTRELLRMIAILMSGKVTDDDVDAIVKILDDVTSASTMQQIKAVVGPQITSLGSFYDRVRIKSALGRAI